jgi:four helix bundle protein
VADRRLTTQRLLLQLFDAGTSIGANLEEASGGQTKRDFIAKVAISTKEARESLYWLRLISATRRALGHEVAPLLEESDRLVAILTTILRSAQANPDRR